MTLTTTRTHTRPPLGSHKVLRDEWIGCEKHAIVLNSLAHQHPVGRVAMECGKFV